MSFGKSTLLGCGRRKKKLQTWNEVRAIRKSFGHFVGRRTKVKNMGIVAVRNSTGVSVTSTKGKLEVLKTHYRHLGSYSVDSVLMIVGKRR